MMTAKEIAAILIAFDEGKRVVRSLNVRGIRDNEQALEIVWLIAEIAEGAHFEVAREPLVVWYPVYNADKQVDMEKPYATKEYCDIANSRCANYTGAVQFKQVIEP